MKKNKTILATLILLTALFSVIPTAFSQKGTYQFHGAAGNQKILKVEIVNSASLTDLYGTNWTDVIEMFGEGAGELNAKFKSVVMGVELDSIHGVPYVGDYDAVTYVTENWDWTTDPFAATPDETLVPIQSLYDPTAITTIVNAVFAMNVTIYNAAIYFTQLPTPVDQYLGAITWEDNWVTSGNTVIHNAMVGEFIFLTTYQYLENCTETWTFDETYGAWIGYKLQDNETNTIYEFNIGLPASAGIPGFELPIVIGAIAIGIISVIVTRIRKRRE